MFYAVAYGHTIRLRKACSLREAAILAFGIADGRLMTVQLVHEEPRCIKKSDFDKVHGELAVRHFRKTGSIVAGFENEPGISNIHWSACPYCRKVTLTEPAEDGVDGIPCIECREKLEPISKEVLAESTVITVRKLARIEEIEYELN